MDEQLGLWRKALAWIVNKTIALLSWQPRYQLIALLQRWEQWLRATPPLPRSRYARRPGRYKRK
jgi:hypothetical protein